MADLETFAATVSALEEQSKKCKVGKHHWTHCGNCTLHHYDVMVCSIREVQLLRSSLYRSVRVCEHSTATVGRHPERSL